MRTKNSLLNASSNLIILITRTVMLFVVRIFFIRILGQVYLGIDSLFTNIISALSIVELGISSAVNYSLYKPLADRNYNKINELMTFYRKLYFIAGILILLLGLFVSLFLNLLLDVNINNLYLFYFLYLINTVSIYFISYKETLIMADQSNYKLTRINFIFYIILYVLRIISLLVFSDFLIYVLILVVITIIQRLYINHFISKLYPEVDFNHKKDLSKNEKKAIYSNIGAMFVHKLGYYIINGTDNIIISATKTLGIIVVGVYTNYLSIVMMLNSVFSGIYKGITSSFGNLAVLENNKTQENVFLIINFLGFILYGFSSIAFYFLLTDFITIVFGGIYALNNSVVLVICLNFYFNGMLLNIDLIKDATGTYKKDVFVPIVQAIINLIVSIILAQYIGLLGVVLGTLISIIIVPIWNKTYIIYKYIFKSSMKSFFITQLKYITYLVITFLCVNSIIKYINIENIYLLFIIKAIIVFVIYIVLFYILYSRNNIFIYLKNELIKLIKERKK